MCTRPCPWRGGGSASIQCCPLRPRRQYVAALTAGEMWLVVGRPPHPAQRPRPDRGTGCPQRTGQTERCTIAGAQSYTASRRPCPAGSHGRRGAPAHGETLASGGAASASRRPCSATCRSQAGCPPRTSPLASVRERTRRPVAGEVPVQHRGGLAHGHGPTGSSSTPSGAAALFFCAPPLIPPSH